MAAGYGAVGWVDLLRVYVACRRIHISGELPKRREIFRHMTAERGLRSDGWAGDHFFCS